MALATLHSSLSFPPTNLCSLSSFRKFQHLRLPSGARQNLARLRLAPCFSARSSSWTGRALKSNAELRDELREFISTMGLPVNRSPSTKELRENGRADLANIVRRRGYKAITELLLSSNGGSHSEEILEGNQEVVRENLNETAGDQERNIDMSLKSSSLEEMVKLSKIACEHSEESLQLKAAKFIQTGELDTEGEDSELYQGLTLKVHEHDNPNEIEHLKSLMGQKELEFSLLRQQIEYETIALSALCAKGTKDLSDMQRLIADKDMELRMAKENLSGLKEVHIDYCTNGQIVEVAGSFNGWQQRIRMDLDPSSGYLNSPGSSKPMPWTTILWLYPGVYEIKFVVDGHWRLDSRRETTYSGSIANNVLTVD